MNAACSPCASYYLSILMAAIMMRAVCQRKLTGCTFFSSPSMIVTAFRDYTERPAGRALSIGRMPLALAGSIRPAAGAEEVGSFTVSLGALLGCSGSAGAFLLVSGGWAFAAPLPVGCDAGALLHTPFISKLPAWVTPRYHTVTARGNSCR